LYEAAFLVRRDALMSDPLTQALFRPRSPARFLIGALTLFGAIVVVLLADTLGFVDCANEASSECTDAGRDQQVVAYIGLIPALCAFVSCMRSRGHPRFWFLMTVLVYALWILLAVRWSNASEPG
jgi:hypothetical protein